MLLLLTCLILKGESLILWISHCDYHMDCNLRACILLSNWYSCSLIYRCVRCYAALVYLCIHVMFKLYIYIHTAVCALFLLPDDLTQFYYCCLQCCHVLFFRHLRCLRNYIHCQLLSAMTIKNFLWISLLINSYYYGLFQRPVCMDIPSFSKKQIMRDRVMIG